MTIDQSPNNPNSLEKLHQLFQSNEQVSEELVGLQLDNLSQNVKQDDSKNIEKMKSDMENWSNGMQKAINEMIPTTVGMSAALFRAKWEEIGKMTPENRNKFFETAEGLNFRTKTVELTKKIEIYMLSDAPAWFEPIAKRFEEVPKSFHPWFNLNGASLGLIGGYTASFFSKKNEGPKTMLITMAISGALGTLPFLSATIFKAVESALEVVGVGVQKVGNMGVNLFMGPARGLGLDNPEAILDGKMKSTRMQEMLRKNLNTLDENTKDLVPENIRPWYSKIIEKNGKGVQENEALAAADYCVKSLDNDVFFTSQDFEKLQANAKAGDWDQIKTEEYWKMLNTAYANRTMQYFLQQPKESPLRILFEKKFALTFKNRKEEQAKKYIQEKLDLKSMYGSKIDNKIEKVQKFGIAADMESGGLKTVLSFIMMLYAAVAGTMQVSQFIQRTKTKKEKDEEENDTKNKDKLKKGDLKDINKAFAEKKKDKGSVKTVLGVLVSAGVITKAVKDDLKNADPEKFFESLTDFKNEIETKNTEGLYRDFKKGIHTLDEKYLNVKLSELNPKLDAAEMLANYASMERRLKNQPINSLFVYVTDPADPTKQKYFSLSSLAKPKSFSLSSFEKPNIPGPGLNFQATYDGKENLNFRLIKAMNGNIKLSIPSKIPNNPEVNNRNYEVKNLTFEKIPNNTATPMVPEIAKKK